MTFNSSSAKLANADLHCKANSGQRTEKRHSYAPPGGVDMHVSISEGAKTDQNLSKIRGNVSVGNRFPPEDFHARLVILHNPQSWKQSMCVR